MSITATSGANSTSSTNQMLQTMLLMLMQDSGMDTSALGSIFGASGNSSSSSDNIFSGTGTNGYPGLNLNSLTSSSEEDIVASISAANVDRILNIQIPPMPTK